MESTNKFQTNRGKSQPCFTLFSLASTFPCVVHLSVSPWPGCHLHAILTFLSEMYHILFFCLHFETILILDSSSVRFLLVALHSLMSLSCTSWLKILSFPAVFYNQKGFSIVNFFVSPYSFSLVAYIYSPIIIILELQDILSPKKDGYCDLARIHYLGWKALSSEICI